MIYDLVVIGGGVGGLTAAAYAAKLGLSVLVCEQNSCAGGMLAAYQQEGFRFDLRMPTVLNMGVLLPALSELGVDGLALRQPSSWKILMARGEVSVTTLTTALEQLAGLYPDQARSLDKLSRELDALAGTLWRHFDPNPLFLRGPQDWGSWVMGAIGSLNQLHRMWRATKVTVDEGLRRFSLSGELRSLLIGLGYEPMSYLLLAGLWQSFATDYFLPPKGISQLPIVLEQRLRATGGEIAVQSTVVEVLVQGGRAAGVRLADGGTILARSVVAACDLVSLYGMLAHRRPFDRLYAQAANTPVTQSYVSLFLGLNETAHNLPFTATHTFWLPDTHAVAATERPDFRRRGLIISSPSLQGPGFAPRGAATMVVSTPAALNWFSGQGERTIRLQVSEGIIHQVAERWPQIGRRIITQRLITPMDYQRLTGNHLGASAGWSMDPHLSTPTGLIPWRTPLPGLYLAGHWVARPGGIAGAMLTAKMAVADLTAHQKSP